MVSNKMVTRIGWAASTMAVLLYVSYIDQITRNLSGHKGSYILAIATVVNSSSWVLYGALKQERDWPIIICNLFGVLIGIITTITSF